MIKSTLTKAEYEEIYAALNRVSPLDTDCGELCGACCCTAEEAGREMGIYLLPGEDKVHDRNDGWLTWTAEDAEDYDFPESWKGKVYFVRCGGPETCRREIRPMQCRTFPLQPHITGDGELMMVYNDLELPYRCPLIDEEIPLNDVFVSATREAWAKLITDPLIYDLVRADSEEREEAVLELEELLSMYC
ncbi:MAG: YkgJ family cysteine cluster protein [Eubacterium sp.]|nr:YkgJ family cysteine cluster protein [Eubacterium sp.]